MYMGVVARPRPDKNFDGKILLLRVSKEKVLKQAASNQRFADNIHLNNSLREGDWRSLHVPRMTVLELRGAIVDYYQLEDDVAD